MKRLFKRTLRKSTFHSCHITGLPVSSGQKSRKLIEFKLNFKTLQILTFEHEKYTENVNVNTNLHNRHMREAIKYSFT